MDSLARKAGPLEVLAKACRGRLKQHGILSKLDGVDLLIGSRNT